MSTDYRQNLSVRWRLSRGGHDASNVGLSFQPPLWADRWSDAAAKSVLDEHDEEFRFPPVMPGEKTRRSDLRDQRRQRQHGCWDHLIVALLWVAYEANLGTLLRTCDAVGGDTLPRRPHGGCGGPS